jgi:peptide/nickel transport system substrate-binding protein
LFWEPEFITARAGVEGILIGPPFEFNYNTLSFGEGAQPASGDPNTIIIGTTDEVNSLDPQDAYATHDWEIIKNTGAPLMKYTPGTADLVLGVAAEEPTVSEDGLVWTVKIREDVTFADGTPVNAQTYVDSWNRLNTLEGQVSGLIQGFVESAEAVDDFTVAYTLNNPTGFFPGLLATAPFIPANPANFAADTINQFPEALDGVGPYRMVSQTPGEQLVLAANPTYFGDDPAIIPNVIIRYFADPTTMSQAVENGEIDIAWRTLGPVEATRLMEVEGLTVTKIDAPALRYLVFNATFMVEE